MPLFIPQLKGRSTKPRVFIACKFSGVVRRAFRRHGFNAWSCDLLSAEDKSPCRFRSDIKKVLDRDRDWALLIAHPPCTHLAVSGSRWFAQKQDEQKEALLFVEYLMAAPIQRIAIENPVSIISSRIRPPDQIIQPWMFGHGEMKRTCFWLKNLPLLQPTNIVSGRNQRIHNLSPSPTRWKERSRTYEGVASAMAIQWGSLL